MRGDPHLNKKGGFKIGCIYGIQNKLNGKWYIGLTVDYESRVRGHKHSLRKEKHRNKLLQRSYDTVLDILNHKHWATKCFTKEEILREER